VEISQELILEYPCEWEYKLFIHSEHDASSIVKEIVDERMHALNKSQASAKGNYVSYSVKLLVHNNEERTALFHAFKTHQHIKFVL